MTPLYQDLGIARDEGIIVANIPCPTEVPDELDYVDGRREFTAYIVEGRLLDLRPEDNKPVKWWVVRQAARALATGMIEPIWSGPIEDFRVESLPRLPIPEGSKLAIRRYSAGPWITL